MRITELFGRFKIWQKLLLVSVVFLMPTGLMSWLYLDAVNYRINFDRDIIAGDEYFLEGIIDLFSDVARSRAATRQYLGGNQGVESQVQSLQANISSSFDRLTTVDARLGAGLGTSAEELKRANREGGSLASLKATWEQIRAATAVKASEEAHLKLLGDMTLLINQVGDESKLILDPDLDTYYVMDALLIRMPTIINLLSQVQATAEELIQRRVTTVQERIALASTLASLQFHLDNVKADFDVTSVNVHKAEFSGRVQFAQNVGEPLNNLLRTVGNVIEQINKEIIYVKETVVSSGDASRSGGRRDKGVEKVSTRAETHLSFADLNAGVAAALRSSQAIWGVFVNEHIAMTNVRLGRYLGYRFWSLTSTLGLLLLVAGLTVLVMLSITRPIKQAAAVAEQLARGELPESIAVGDARDETSMLLHAINDMLQFLDLRNTIANLQASARTLVETVSDLDRQTNEQTTAINTQAAALQETQITAQEIKQTSLLASQKAEAVLTQAERAETIGRTGEQAVEQSLHSLADIQGQVEEIAQKIGKLSERTVQIGDITQTVKDLADQSNMLALNAAIEAVRSGEHGKGFAVVAREIRNLADQSIQATNRVREILEDITGAVRAAVAITDAGARKIEAGIVQMNASGEKIKDLSSIVKDSSAAVRQIAAAVSQQNAGITQIFTAVTDQNKMMEDTIKRLEATRSAATMVRQVSDKVGGVVERFHI